MSALCPLCQRPLPAGHVGGNCPACLLGAALSDPPDCFSETLAEQTPTDLGDYEILAEIGRGGTGVVYRARQRQLNRIVALKTLHGSALTSRDAFERLQTEAQAVARLDHPNIVPLYEVGRHSGTHFLTLRYFEHGSLAEALKRRRLTPTEAARCVALAARAVHHAHSRGVLHRDLKPSNLLLDEQGDPHVADFGLAKLADSDSSLTLSTSVLGTPAYMAPEQATGNAKEAGTPADIYSLGAVLFELLTGRAPFLGRSSLDVLRQVADQEPPRPSSLVPGLDRDLEAVCLRCLEKNPSRRYASAAALAEDLERWQRQEPLSIRPLSASERTLKWVRRRPLIASLAAAATVAVILGVTGVLWQYGRAIQAAELARSNELDARRNAYLAEMNAANSALDKGDWSGVRAILERTRPQPGQEDLRGWEWRYLWGVSRSDAQRRFRTGSREIVSLVALPDGDTVAIGEKEGGFSLWNVRTGERRYEFPEPINRTNFTHFPLNRVSTRLALVPGTTLLAYTDCRGENESFIRLWDTTTRTVRQSLPLPGVPRDLAVSPDGRWLACSTIQGDRKVYLFELPTGRLARTFSARFTERAYGSPLAFSPDSQWIAFEVEGGEQGPSAIIQIAEVTTGREVHRLLQGQFQVVALSFSPDGRWLASGGALDRTWVRIWDLRTGTLAHSLVANSSLALAFNPQGDRLFAGFDVWKVPDFSRERVLAGEGGEVSVNCLLADGETYLTASGPTVAQWNLLARPRPRQGVTLSLSLRAGEFLPNGQGLLLIPPTNRMVYRAIAPHYDCLPIPELGTNCQAVAFLEIQNRIAIGHRDGRVTLHDGDDYHLLGELTGTGRPVTRFWWFEKQGLLAVYRYNDSSATDTIEVWDPSTRRLTWQTETEPWWWRDTVAPQQGIHWQIFADGRLVGQDLIHHRVLRRNLGPGTHTGAAFLSDGRRVLNTQWGRQQLLDLETGRTLNTLETLRGTSHGAVVWPDDSRWMLTNCRIIDPQTGRLLLDLEFPIGTENKPAVSDDGSQLALLSDSNHSTRTCLWWAPSWEEIRREEKGAP